MHTLQRRLRRATGLGVIAMLAVPLAAQAADNRAQLSESFNSGLASARPSMTLTATSATAAAAHPSPPASCASTSTRVI